MLEDNILDYAGNWAGTGTIAGAGDAEQITLDAAGEFMVSGVVDTGLHTIELLQNEYAAGNDVTLQYRHGATEAACEAAGWNVYLNTFDSAGFVQTRLDYSYREKVLGYGPIAYWMQGEASGNDAYCQVNAAQDGAYTGVTLGQTGIGDGRTSPFFDGANDFNNVQTAALAAAFDGQEGSLLVWAKVSGAGIWTDAVTRRMIYFVVDGNNYVLLMKHPAANTVRARYMANGVLKTNQMAGISPITWMCWVLTWSKTADTFKVYLGGVQQGATLNGLGVWAGNPVTSLVGAGSVLPIQVWDGWLAHAALFDSVLGQPAITDLASV